MVSAVKEGATLSQLERERRGWEEERKSFWEERVLTQSKKRKDIVSDALSLTYNSMSVHDKLLCATNSKVDAEYCAKIFETTSKNPELSEKSRNELGVLAKEFGRMARDDAIFEKMYVVVELGHLGRAEEARELLKEVKPQIVGMAQFYIQDMDAKLKEGLASYIADPQISKSIVAWNTIREDIAGIVKLLDVIEKNVDATNRNRFHDAVQSLASVRYYEEELAIAYARKAGVFNEVRWNEIYETYYRIR
jgi:hypothetical protein